MRDSDVDPLVADVSGAPDPPDGPDTDTPLVRGATLPNPFEEALGRIVSDIRSGRIENGSRLPPERDLAEELDVSRSTIRSVIRALQQAGVVRTQRGRTGGSFVTWERSTRDYRSRRLNDPMRARIKDMLRFRSVLEPGAAVLAAERDLSPTEKQHLGALLAAATTSSPGFRVADAELHLYVAELADCQALQDAIANIQLILNETLLEVVPVMGPALEHSHQAHAHLVDAILTGDSRRARDVMSSHVAATAHLLHSFLE